MAKGAPRTKGRGVLDDVVENPVEHPDEIVREGCGVGPQRQRKPQVDLLETGLDQVATRLARQQLPDDPLEDFAGDLAQGLDRVGHDTPDRPPSSPRSRRPQTASGITTGKAKAHTSPWWRARTNGVSSKTGNSHDHRISG